MRVVAPIVEVEAKLSFRRGLVARYTRPYLDFGNESMVSGGGDSK